MVKIKVNTRTTYIIDLPIDSFEEITEDEMSIKDSDEMIMNYLNDYLQVRVDEITGVFPV